MSQNDVLLKTVLFIYQTHTASASAAGAASSMLLRLLLHLCWFYSVYKLTDNKQIIESISSHNTSMTTIIFPYINSINNHKIKYLQYNNILLKMSQYVYSIKKKKNNIYCGTNQIYICELSAPSCFCRLPPAGGWWRIKY